MRFRGAAKVPGRRRVISSAFVLGGLACLVLATGASASFVVANTDPSGPGSLRQAIIDANSAAGPDTIDATGVSGTINLAGELPGLSSATVNGPGSGQLTIRRDTGGAYPLMQVGPTATVEISGIKFTGSTQGGVANLGGVLTLDHVVVTDNTTTAGIYNAIDATTTIRNSTISGNHSGGVFNQGGTLVLDHVLVNDNTATEYAGIFSISSQFSLATTTIRDSTISGNQAVEVGGGVSNYNQAILTIERSTIVGNSATKGGGGILYGGNGNPSSVTIRNSTITGNSTGPAANFFGGGGILAANSFGQLTIESSTVSSNSAPTGANISYGVGSFTSLQSTIVSNPLGGGANCAGNLISHDYNVSDDGSCWLLAGHDQATTNPQLGALADNGGPTQTMLPAQSSPVIDKGFADALTDDQRGPTRPVDLPGAPNAGLGDAADVGAVELKVGDIGSAMATVAGGPSGPTNNTMPTFTFTRQNWFKTECSIDDRVTIFYGGCSGPGSTHTPLMVLADGDYAFRVQATNLLNQQATDLRTFTVDTVPPTATVDSGPSGITGDSTPTFTFGSDGPATFECRTYARGSIPPVFGSCSGPGHTETPASALADDNYKFDVRATDQATNHAVGSRDFAVDATAPTVGVNSGPNGPTADATPTFAFSADEAVEFECRLYAEGSTPPAYEACSGPGSMHTSAPELADGEYMFGVQGTDVAQNQTAAFRTFSVTAAACAKARTALEGAQAVLAKAEKALKKAKKRLKKAKVSHDPRKIGKAKKAVKKAKKQVNEARATLSAALAEVERNCAL